MAQYLATVILEITVEAPNASVARAVGERAFAHKLHPTDLKPGMSVSNIKKSPIKVEKVK